MLPYEANFDLKPLIVVGMFELLKRYARPRSPRRGRWVVIFRVEGDKPTEVRGKRFSSLSKARRFQRRIRFGILRRWHAKDWRTARWDPR